MKSNSIMYMPFILYHHHQGSTTHKFIHHVKKAFEGNNNFCTQFITSPGRHGSVSHLFNWCSFLHTIKVIRVGEIVGQRHFELISTITQSQELQLSIDLYSQIIATTYYQSKGCWAKQYYFLNHELYSHCAHHRPSQLPCPLLTKMSSPTKMTISSSSPTSPTLVGSKPRI